MQSRKGQYSVMEYLFLTIFVLMIIFGLIFFLFVFQGSQSSFEMERNVEGELFTLTSRVVVSPFLVQSDSLFDDAKLTALQALSGDEECEEFHRIFGQNAFLKVKDLDFVKEINIMEDGFQDLDALYEGSDVECTEENYGEVLRDEPLRIAEGGLDTEYPANLCNYWEFCVDPDRKFRANIVPVNIVRRMGRVLDSGTQDITDMGTLTVGVYIE